MLRGVQCTWWNSSITQCVQEFDICLFQHCSPSHEFFIAEPSLKMFGIASGKMRLCGSMDAGVLLTIVLPLMYIHVVFN